MSKETKYEIVQVGERVGSEENSIVGIDEIKKITIELAQENNMALVDKEGWIKYINHGAPLEPDSSNCLGFNQHGYAFESFKDDLAEETIFALCSEILEVVEVELLRVCNTHKIRIGFTQVLPKTEEDDDQVLHQMGYSNSIVSKFELYIDNKHIANYGSVVYGEQDVRVNYADEDNTILVPIGDGEEYGLHKEPETLLKAKKLQKEEGEEYVYYSMNCWLEGFYEDIKSNDLTEDNPDIKAETEYVHGSICENMDIKSSVVEMIVNQVKLDEVA